MGSKKTTIPLPLVGKLYDQVVRVVKHESHEENEKDIILYVGRVYNHMIDAVKEYEKKEKKKFRIGLIYDSRRKLCQFTEAALDRLDIVLSCDTSSHTALQKTLSPFASQILSITCRAEGALPVMANIIPNIPHVSAPTTESIHWSTDKIEMRERLMTHDSSLSPKFTIVTDGSKDSIRSIEDKVGYPLVVKPSGIAESLLVSICYHQEELEETLRKVFKKIDSLYKKNGFVRTPRVLVEQFMEGDQYSIDAYIDHSGKITFTPIVYIKTGRSIGFDDFFGYLQMTPTNLNKASVLTAEITATEAIRALALRSTSIHLEMYKTEQGWKVIELSPRVGGFRHMLYEFSYGINHTMNDILVRLGKKLIVPKSKKGYSAAMKFFAKKEGKLIKLTGIKKAQELKSFKRIYISKKVGDSCTYAKHGGVSVFNIILFNKDRSLLLADIRRLEKMIHIETK